jgi:hypothetical protein
MSTQPQNTNEILETSISIHNLSTASEITQRILDLGPSAARITKLYISTDFSNSEDKFTNEHVVSLVQPITQILTHISSASASASLTHFAWLAPSSTTSPFTRPSEFWAALYIHAPTLRHLTLDFFEHEVATLPPPPAFPALRTLGLDTSSAHGDDGTSIHALLTSCPLLTALTFEWPACDLETCQIQNIQWSAYTFPALTALELNGWDFAPVAFAAFLARHRDVERFVDGVDGPYVDENEEHIGLAATVFPKLRELWKRRGSERGMGQYFNVEARRPIKRLVLDVEGFDGAKKLQELGACGHAQKLKELELRGPSRAWRVKEWESDSSEDEDGKRERKSKEAETPPILLALRTVLDKLDGLKELGIELESSSYYSKNSKTGEYENDELPNQDDLVRILAHIPSMMSLRTLRLGDESVDKLDEAWLEDMRGVPDGLEVLGWGKGVYGIERVDGRIRGVKKEGEVWRGWDERWGVESSNGVWRACNSMSWIN